MNNPSLSSELNTAAAAAVEESGSGALAQRHANQSEGLTASLASFIKHYDATSHRLGWS